MIASYVRDVKLNNTSAEKRFTICITSQVIIGVIIKSIDTDSTDALWKVKTDEKKTFITSDWINVFDNSHDSDTFNFF